MKVEKTFGQSTVTSALASSPMKLLTPIARGKSVWAFTSSFGGGLVAGDQTQLEVTVGTGANCYLSTQSSTKIYRNPSTRPCSHTTNAVLDPESLLIFAPEPVQAFAESQYTQRQKFDLRSGAGLVLLDWFTSGRAARGERWAFARLESRNDIFLNGERVLVDSILLSSTTVRQYMGRFNCYAVLLLMGTPLKAAVDALVHAFVASPIEKRGAHCFSASPIQDGILIRIAGIEVENVRRTVQEHLGFAEELLGDNPWARKW